MSPVDTTLRTVRRAVRSFHPAVMPPLSRGHYRRELAAWSLLPVMLGALEGGVVGVLAKNIFADAVSPAMLNFMVGVVTGAQAFANVTSFMWAAWSHGRHKIRFLVVLQVAAAVGVGVMALAPRSPGGLILFAAAVVGSRVCWSGVVTLRSTVWRANYPRQARANMAGKLATVQSVIMAATGIAVGLATSANPDAFRLLYPLAALFGAGGALVYGGLRMRGHRALVRAERDSFESRRWFAHPLQMIRALADDRPFRHYMLTMFVFGTGNLMIGAPLVIVLNDRFAVSPHVAILISSSIPVVLMPVSIPLWSRLLDNVHIIGFRSVHSWTFVMQTASYLAGAVLMQPALMIVGAVFQGLAYGGGVLAWNLGHHDFAPPEKASQYMGVHVTMTGVRGVFAPLLAVAIYLKLEAWRPGAGAWVFAVCLALNLSGAIGFLIMRRAQKSAEHRADFADTGPPVQPPAS